MPTNWWESGSAGIPITPFSGPNPSNYVSYNIQYQYNIIVFAVVDINNFYNVFQGPGAYSGPPPWLQSLDIYNGATLLYGIGDLNGLVWDSSNNLPFNSLTTPTPEPGIAFWTSDANIISNFYNLMSITSLSIFDADLVSINGGPVPCFLEGSEILTADGYRPIETLKVGDLVKTYRHDLVAIHSIGRGYVYNPANQERIKNRLYVCKKENYPDLEKDLVITGCHSILVNEMTDQQKKQTRESINTLYFTDSKYRLMAYIDDRTECYPVEGTMTIYHIALEHPDIRMNYGIYANGLLVETTSIRYLKQFSNMQLI